jgi:hypothetical protein
LTYAAPSSLFFLPYHFLMCSVDRKRKSCALIYYLFLLFSPPQWSQLMHLGNATPDNVYEDRLKKLAVNQCCTLIYTVSSGSFLDSFRRVGDTGSR